MQDFTNKIICGDCIELLNGAKEPFADLIFADPPFNIGYQYDKYKDRLKSEKYISWTRDWIGACFNVLKPNGSFYIAMGDDYAAEIKIEAEKKGLFLRNWIIWHYSFGQQTKNKFARSHTHIFYFVKNKDEFTYNHKDARIISDRQRKYKDKRAKLEGKMPDDVWNEYPRICGTFEEREEWFPCQMPESILARIIRVSSKQDNVVFDPFSGSGTTCVVAHKLKRKYAGIDISPYYVKEARKRIRDSEGLTIEGEGKPEWNSHFDAELKWLYHENKVSSEDLENDEFLLSLFTNKFNQRIDYKTNLYTPKDIIKRLISLRKASKLGPLRR